MSHYETLDGPLPSTSETAGHRVHALHAWAKDRGVGSNPALAAYLAHQEQAIDTLTRTSHLLEERIEVLEARVRRLLADSHPTML